jgi:hypothetical protein
MVNESYGWSYRITDYIVFPMGFVMDDKHIYVSYGKNDKSAWCLKLDRKGLLASLKPVNSTVMGISDYDYLTGEIKRHSFRYLSHP